MPGPCPGWLGLSSAQMSHKMRLVALFSVTSLLAAPLATGAYADPAGTTVYVVQPGDTLSDIASTTGADPDVLARLNGLDDANLLSVGQSLKVPSKASSPAAPLAV